MAEANQKISKLTDPNNFPILADISKSLTDILAVALERLSFEYYFYKKYYGSLP